MARSILSFKSIEAIIEKLENDNDWTNDKLKHYDEIINEDDEITFIFSSFLHFSLTNLEKTNNLERKYSLKCIENIIEDAKFRFLYNH